jgi:hypothetical protein
MYHDYIFRIEKIIANHRDYFETSGILLQPHQCWKNLNLVTIFSIVEENILQGVNMTCTET